MLVLLFLRLIYHFAETSRAIYSLLCIDGVSIFNLFSITHCAPTKAHSSLFIRLLILLLLLLRIFPSIFHVFLFLLITLIVVRTSMSRRYYCVALSQPLLFSPLLLSRRIPTEFKSKLISNRRGVKKCALRY